MIPALRRTWFARLLSVATLLCVVTLSTSSLVHHDDGDADCGPLLIVHDHSAHRFVPDAASSAEQPEHCYLCHWSSLRTVEAAVPFHAPMPDSRRLASVDAVELFPVADARQPARAPPVA